MILIPGDIIPGDIISGDIILGDIIPGDIMLVIFCWWYFAGDISSVHQVESATSTSTATVTTKQVCTDQPENKHEVILNIL